jgi:hypothetical protein
LICGGGIFLAVFFLRTPEPEVKDQEKIREVSNFKDEKSTQTKSSVSVNVTAAEASSPNIADQQAFHNTKEFQQESKRPLNAVSLEKFKEMAKKALKTLPKQVRLEGLNEEEAHFPTAKRLQELEPFINIVQAVADNPQLEPAAFIFYNKCASDDKLNLTTTLRSRCLSHLRSLQDKLGKKAEVENLTNHLDPEIVRLSDAIN